jgi:hypothetical protein
VPRITGIVNWCPWCQDKKHFDYPEQAEESKNYSVSLPVIFSDEKTISQWFCPNCAEQVKDEVTKTENGYKISDIFRIFPKAVNELALFHMNRDDNQ